MEISIKSPQEILQLQEGGKRLNLALNKVIQAVRPGITTLELEKILEREIKKNQGLPSFKGYKGYPACLCASINAVVVHGIPKPEQLLKEGDLIGLDAGMIYKNLYTDMAVTVGVGKISKAAQHLIQGTEAALKAGILAAKPGKKLGNISWHIQEIAKKYHLGIVKNLTGHGVGYAVHEQPPIPNFGEKDSGPILKENMVLAIEPMFCLGDNNILVDKDGWTITTQDQSLAAHFEHTIAITKTAAKILTA